MKNKYTKSLINLSIYFVLIFILLLSLLFTIINSSNKLKKNNWLESNVNSIANNDKYNDYLIGEVMLYQNINFLKKYYIKNEMVSYEQVNDDNITNKIIYNDYKIDSSINFGNNINIENSIITNISYNDFSHSDKNIKIKNSIILGLNIENELDYKDENISLDIENSIVYFQGTIYNEKIITPNLIINSKNSIIGSRFNFLYTHQFPFNRGEEILNNTFLDYLI